MEDLNRWIIEKFGSVEFFVTLMALLVGVVGVLYARAQFKLQKTQQINSEIKPPPEKTNKERDDPHVIKTEHASQSDLERIKHYFKVFSPPSRPIKQGPMPVADEVWKLKTTFPSGLFIRDNTDDLRFGLKSFLLHLLGGEETSSNDFRGLQHLKDEVKNSDKSLYYDWKETMSAAWHPTENLLATAGYSGIVKLWDIERKALINRDPFWSTYSSGDTLCWSFDGSFFVSDRHSFSGITGEPLRRSDSTSWLDSNYSSRYLEFNRGISINDRGTSHLSSTHNFTPWKPGTTLLSVHRYSDSTNLVLMDAKTGDLEKKIDCGIPSFITDIAWHPGGKVVAISFKDHNIRLIDVENNLTIDGLSVGYIVGWSTDGRTLVARKERTGNEFIIWDAIEMREKPMPEETRNAIWVKRFFKNMSADSSRYVEIKQAEATVYSTISEKELFVIPKKVISAAWSPKDGGLLATCAGSETDIWQVIEK